MAIGPISSTQIDERYGSHLELVELIGSNTLIHGKLSKSNEILVASIPGVIKENLKGKDLNLSLFLYLQESFHYLWSQ